MSAEAYAGDGRHLEYSGDAPEPKRGGPKTDTTPGLMEATPSRDHLGERVEALVRRVGKGAVLRALGCSKSSLDRARTGQSLRRGTRIQLEQALAELERATATNERTTTQ